LSWEDKLKLLAQQGYAKAGKIEAGLESSSIQGVILSPRYEKPDRLQAYVGALKKQFTDAAVLVDPQFYATVMSPQRLGYLPLYDSYFRPELTRKDFIGQSKISAYVSSVLTFQEELEVDYWVSPGILFNAFTDGQSQIALALAEESFSYHQGVKGAPPLLLTFVVNESALHDTDGLFEFLDLVTSWDVAGFYILVARNTPKYPAPFEPRALANLMYLAYVLGEVNQREVVCGYSDLVGLPLVAAGATSLGTGWWNTSRQFCKDMFEESRGGRRPKARYTSLPLMSSILLIPELANAAEVLSLEQILSGTHEDQRLRRGISDENWPPDVACLHHWQVISQALAGLDRPTAAERIELLDEQIRKSLRLHDELRRLGVPFESAAARSQLTQWIQAVDIFQTELLDS
jgi:hypothetical protein